MTKILRNAKVYYGSRYSWNGERTAEIRIDDNGRERYAAVRDIGEDALYYVSGRSLFDELTAEECADINDAGIIVKFETGPLDEFETEKTMMCKSEYYKCFLYLHKLIQKKDNKIDDVIEYTEDYGKDINSMKLRSLQQDYERNKKMNLSNRIIFDENRNKKYAVYNISCDESSGKIMDAILAEAVIEDKGKTRYIEACWISEVYYNISFEINNESIHDILVNEDDVDELDRIRKRGHISYYSYEDAMKSKYTEVIENLTMLISNKLEETGRFKDYDKKELKRIKWYQPYKD